MISGMASDALRDELLREPAPGWRPEPGDVLIGRVIGFDERPGFAGVMYPIIEVERDDGERVAVHAFHTVLRDELARHKPKRGDRLGIAYHGERRTGDGDNTYQLYRVRVVRNETDAAELTAVDVEAIGEPQAEVETPVLCPGCGTDALSDPFAGPNGDLRQCASCGKVSTAEEIDAADIPF
jgi:hypothetical protein